jgi:triosephosphate isomerase
MPERSLMAANWKMYKTVGESAAYAKELARRMESLSQEGPEQVICPTLPALYTVGRALSQSSVKVGAQSLDLGLEGANTGAVSGYLIREAGASYVIVGHSERRQLYGEDDALVAHKAAAAAESHLIPIICVGETELQRKAEETDQVVRRQVTRALENLADSTAVVVAYEPLWAIGTGVVPDPVEANRVAELIRDAAEKLLPETTNSLRILYGGSVNRGNIRDFARQPHLDGALVGGASLDVGHWLDLIQGWQEVRR